MSRTEDQQHPTASDVRESLHTLALPDKVAGIWSLGQAGFVVAWNGIKVMIDPYLSDWVYELAGKPWVREFAPPLHPAEDLGIDYVLCTHHHEDHMDKLTLHALAQASARTVFVVPTAHIQLMNDYGIPSSRIRGIDHGECLNLHGGISVHAHAAKHEDYATTEDGHHHFLSYVLRFGEDLDLFHSGDTIAFRELEDWVKPFQPDIAMLPINGRDFVRQSAGIAGNMNYREAADFGARVGARLLVPMHVGLFKHNDENPAYFVDYLKIAYPNQAFHLFAPGERLCFLKG